MKMIWLLMKVKVNMKAICKMKLKEMTLKYGETDDTDEATAESGSG